MSDDRKGKLIVFEGIDGSGKSTHINLVSKALFKMGINHICHHELQNPIGELIRTEYLSGKSETNDYSLGMLFEAQRLHYLQEEGGIIELLNNGTSIIQDRYYHSTIAYLMYKLEQDHLLLITQSSRLIARPDLTIFIDTDPEIAITRIKDRLNKNLTIFETLDQLKQFRSNYHCVMDDLIKYEDENIYTFDDNLPINEITSYIIDKICSLYEK